MKKITNYKYDGSKEETELRELRHTSYDWKTTDEEDAIFGLRSFFTIEKQIEELKNKIKDLEQRKDHLKNVKISETLYQVWFYFAPDIYNNGGVSCVLTRSQLDHLIQRGSELTDVFFLEIFDINESLKQERKVVPDFLPDSIKEQLNNENYNRWHNRLLNE